MKKRFSFKFFIFIILLLGLIALGVYAYIKGVREHKMQYVLHTAKAYLGLA